MARCSRCGRETHIEYGYDGLPYCNSCIFYGMNKPCWKCRMYLPVSELQQYKGQWLCPYCLMDSRDEDRRIEERGSESHLKGYQTSERCERCGRTLSIVYYLGGRRLCESCIEEAKKDWGEVGGERPPMSMYRVSAKKEREAGLLAFLEALFSELLGRLGIKIRKKKREGEIVALRPKKKRAFVPFAKPMKEGKMEKEQEPMIEGPKKKKEKKKKKKKSKEEEGEEKEKKKDKFDSFKKD